MIIKDVLQTIFNDFTRGPQAECGADFLPLTRVFNTFGSLRFALPPDILRSLSPHFPTCLFAIGLSAIHGHFNALTLHVSLSYLVFKKVLSYKTFVLRSLCTLFRGQRRTL